MQKNGALKSMIRALPALAEPSLNPISFPTHRPAGLKSVVAPMTDVSSIALSSSSGLKVRSATAPDRNETASVPTGSITVDLRQISEPVPVENP